MPLRFYRAKFVNGPMRREHPLVANPPLWRLTFWRRGADGLPIRYRYYLLPNQERGLGEYAYTFIGPKGLVGDSVLPEFE